MPPPMYTQHTQQGGGQFGGREGLGTLAQTQTQFVPVPSQP
jgi:hypothetical protein